MLLLTSRQHGVRLVGPQYSPRCRRPKAPPQQDRPEHPPTKLKQPLCLELGRGGLSADTSSAAGSSSMRPSSALSEELRAIDSELRIWHERRRPWLYIVGRASPPARHPTTTLTHFPPVDPDDPTLNYRRERMECMLEKAGVMDGTT